MKIYIVLAYHVEVPGCIPATFTTQLAANEFKDKVRRDHGKKNVKFDEFETTLDEQPQPRAKR